METTTDNAINKTKPFFFEMTIKMGKSVAGWIKQKNREIMNDILNKEKDIISHSEDIWLYIIQGITILIHLYIYMK